ncbi:MAG: glutaredoxin family protein [Candidatus Thiodiazotropha sp. (ex Lucinoma borealis)]|nr:glutaredoxin family protein [Candidatus Thiodiazotropha sp. (ex Lucinoma borealis)]MCU7840325.1 glutaredoxin family protein [Candidatus Thiodiazotropha sp. (ex Troendleina suluensis)]MCU7947113.1 glutaredoxin family protein [Candidatus Thiodiazotropha sp. (ex Cardiolucina cf. quadrata)]MCU7854363.1 glutaredoxin family protein [Candidatus Thiodiazotropha sp. (ex Lucinoma borealis)]MCU7863012.1 glutaredoxin family protein [Candidatus Thiodiazotropha sp. (ex Lucinoma borealis)]
MSHLLRFYYRDGCHLCDDMLEELIRLRSEWQFDLIEVDIDRSPEIREKYNTQIPLLEDAQGSCLSEYYLDRATLLRYLRGA